MREIVEVTGDEVKLSLPEALRGKKLEIIILPIENKEDVRPSRKLGLLKNKVYVPPSFFDPLPEDTLKDFGIE